MKQRPGCAHSQTSTAQTVSWHDEHWQDLGKGSISASCRTTELAEQLKSPMKCHYSKHYKCCIQANTLNWNSLDVSQAYDCMN